MAKIQQLSQHVADLIAAGEVVERPASCIKELVENAVDAGAKTVTVEIQNGGMTFLRVSDDGCGMEKDDAKTAFLRHATSKLRTKEDLQSIATLGFRGEALAAISAVSRIDLLTKTADCTEGTSLHLEAGKLTAEQPVGCPDGTTIIVRDLFFNTPARMKFMKSDVSEASAAAAVVCHLALANPDVGFRFIKDGEELLHTPGDAKLFSAVYAVLGRQLANEMTEVNGHFETISTYGYVTKPTCTRGNRQQQQFFVNGRFVKSKLLMTALEQAYQNQMMVGRYPSCVLHLTLPVQAVDVNVHPAKTEVKFLREKEVFDAVHYAVLSALNKTPARPEMKLPEKKRVEEKAYEQLPITHTVQMKNDFFKTVSSEQFRSQNEKTVLHEDVRLPVRDIPTKTPKLPEKQKPVEKLLSTPVVPQAAIETPDYRIIGEALDTYIIVEQNEQLLFIDKHAAHERILFEKLKKQAQPVMPQLLLAPITAALSPEEAAAVLENGALFSSLGFEIDDFGDSSLLIRQIPSQISLDDAAQTVQELAAQLLSGVYPDKAAQNDALLHTIACKAAIKAGSRTDAVERERLVKEVLSREELKYCPHGRPICTVLTKSQLERQFKRA